MLETVVTEDGQLIVVPDSLVITLWRNVLSTIYMHPAVLVHPDLAELRSIFIENNVIHEHAAPHIIIPLPASEDASHSLRPKITFPNAAIQVIFGEITDFDIQDSEIVIRSYQLCTTVKEAVAELAHFIRIYPRALHTADYGFVYDFLVRFGLSPKMIYSLIRRTPPIATTSIPSPSHTTDQVRKIVTVVKPRSDKSSDVRKRPSTKDTSGNSQRKHVTFSSDTKTEDSGPSWKKLVRRRPRAGTDSLNKSLSGKQRGDLNLSKSQLQKQHGNEDRGSIQHQHQKVVKMKSTVSQKPSSAIGSASSAVEYRLPSASVSLQRISTSEFQSQTISNTSEEGEPMIDQSDSSVAAPVLPVPVLPQPLQYSDYVSKYKLRQCSIPIRDCRDDLQQYDRKLNFGKTQQVHVISPKNQNGISVPQLTKVKLPLLTEDSRQLYSTSVPSG